MAEEEKVLEAVELAKATGKIKKGTNETTKAVERGKAKLVVIAKDVTPPEITMHLPLLCKEKEIACVEIAKKEELGGAAGLPIGTSAIAIINEGDSKKIVAELSKMLAKEQEAEKKEKVNKEDKGTETKKEEKEEKKPKAKEEKKEDKEEAKSEEVKQEKKEKEEDKKEEPSKKKE